MREFRDLDTTALKAFYFAATTQNFTEAARRANMTQSGISQHIAKIESTLRAQLFLRVGRRVQLSASGLRFMGFVETFLDQLENVVDDLGTEQEALAGRVAYAMPASCRFTPHFPLLLEKRKNFAGIDLRVHFGPTDEVQAALLAGTVDFGFMTKNTHHPDLVFQEFAEEEYALVGAPEFELHKLDLKKLSSIPFIKYPGVDVLFEYWLKAYFPRARNLPVGSLRLKGEVNSLNGAILMAQHGLGVTVFPKHCVASDLSSKTLRSFSSRSHHAPTNKIYIAQLVNKVQPKRVRAVLDTFWEMVE